MAQQVTRKDLVKLYKAFECSEWKKGVMAYLNSTVTEDDNFKVDVKDEDIKYIKTNATPQQKEALEEVGIDVGSATMKKFKNMDDVWKHLGLDPEDVLPYPESKRLTKRKKAANAFVKIGYIQEAFGWIPDFNNSSQYKYYPYFQKTARGWVFCVYGSCYVNGSMGFGFYFETAEIATYVGKTFIDIFNDYLPE